MTLLAVVGVPAGNESAVGTVCPGDRPVGVDLAGIGTHAVGEASVPEYATAVGAGFSLPESFAHRSGVGAVGVIQPIPCQPLAGGRDK